MPKLFLSHNCLKPIKILLNIFLQTNLHCSGLTPVLTSNAFSTSIQQLNFVHMGTVVDVAKIHSAVSTVIAYLSYKCQKCKKSQM